MIHHYINLVCWRPMLALYDTDRDLVWIDSGSLRDSLARLRPDAEYRPGSSILPRIGPGTPEGKNWFFFTAGPVAHLSADNQMPLPFFDVVSLPDHIASILKALPEDTRVGIGISSPKQNYLAALMHALRPDLEYHCLGAAITVHFAQRCGKPPALSGSSFEWLKFLVWSPRRTLGKIVTTLGEMLAIRLHGPSRDDFAHFAQICMPVQECAENMKGQSQ
jgi:hypothetical protein